jgi:hypothetical protein
MIYNIPKSLQVENVKLATHTFVNTMFYFLINASIVAFLSNHISFGILMTNFSKFASKFKKPRFFTFPYYYFVGHLVVMRVVTSSRVVGLRENFHHVQKERRR